MKNRMVRVNEEVKRRVSEILIYDMHDPRARWISITRCEVSSDLKRAEVYFLTFGDETEEDALMFLNKASGYIREMLKQRIYLKYVPKLHFSIDRKLKWIRNFDEGFGGGGEGSRDTEG